MKEYLKLKNLHSLFERNFFLLNSLVDDFDENKASDLIARSICTNKLNNLNYKNLNTGRSNIYSTKSGLFIYNANNLIKLNDNSKIAISAIRPFSKVEQNQELITAKVIPYGIDKKLLQKKKSNSQSCFLDLNLLVNYWGENQQRTYQHLNLMRYFNE